MLREQARVLGIDLGSRRIGVAVTDALGLTAQPVTTLPRHGGQRDLEAIGELVARYQAARVVVGLPVNPEPVGPAAGPGGGRAEAQARAFAERLQTALGLPVELCDEAFTTVEAEAVLLQADLSRARRRQVVDRVAAALILQRWLERRTAGERAGADAEGGR